MNSTMNSRGWRTHAVILLCGGMALTIAIGGRQNMGLYLHPKLTGHF